MNYTQYEANGQLKFLFSTAFLMMPSFLNGFNNTETTIETTRSLRNAFCFHGTLDLCNSDCICVHCGRKMHVNNHRDMTLRHLCFGSSLSCVKFSSTQLLCPECGATKMQTIPFKADGHFVISELFHYTRDLLAHESIRSSR